MDFCKKITQNKYNHISLKRKVKTYPFLFIPSFPMELLVSQPKTKTNIQFSIIWQSHANQYFVQAWSKYKRSIFHGIYQKVF